MPAPVASRLVPIVVGALVAFSAALALKALPAFAEADIAVLLLLGLTFTGVGGVIAARVRANAFGWMLLAIGVCSSVAAVTGTVEGPRAAIWLGNWIWWVPVGLAPVALLVFPTGRPPQGRVWRLVAVVSAVGLAAPAMCLAIASALHLDPLGLYEKAPGGAPAEWVGAARVAAFVAGFALLAALVSLLVRLRGATDLQRRQVVCLLLGGLTLSIMLVLGAFGVSVPGLWVPGAMAVPLAAGVAILWHRLYDLDLVLNRGLVYLSLSLALLAAYGAAVWVGNHALSGLLPGESGPLIAVAAVAVAIEPLRRRLQRAVDRLLFGNRADPYAVVTALGRRMESSSDARALLPDVAEAVADNLALPYVAIEIAADGDGRRSAEWGRRIGAEIVVPLTYRGEQIGRLLAAPRTIGHKLAPRDRRLLEDLTRQVSLTVHAIELSEGLQRAREQLVDGREEERRRLRRDLHDGLGPGLAAMGMQLDAASNTLERDPRAVQPILRAVRTAAFEAVADIRRIVDELRPAALDDLGLAGAVRASAEQFATAGHGEPGLTVSLDVPAELRPLPAAVEVAALRIVQEAVANAARHSGACNCLVRLSATSDLDIEVADDGSGLPAAYSAGVGLGSMRERAEELGGRCMIDPRPGGGTIVRVSLPLRAP